jgi:hypothetical protein
VSIVLLIERHVIIVSKLRHVGSVR